MCNFSMPYILEQLVVGRVQLWDLNLSREQPNSPQADITHVSLLTLLAFHWHHTMITYIWENFLRLHPHVPALLQAGPVTAVLSGVGGFMTGLSS